MAFLEIGEKDDGANLDLQAGDRIKIELNENPTTGYLWEIGNINVKDLKIIGNEFKTPDGNAAGAGGLRKMVFEVIKKSKGDLVLESRQKWSREIYKTLKLSYT
ncbi:protease inhibitor I42 family protein [Daejeonella oryzae]|uniref:protease inhibitor I42 family protein n=1 Tax=Daejeonella oryzae TaxID=1122943 RepID=UPI00041F44F1|nr:protease inhibitor I42 family protein [Daejeonella oryzae]